MRIHAGKCVSITEKCVSMREKGIFYAEKRGYFIMYLHIGQNELLPENRIIGIFDLDKTTAGKRTREYLSRAQTDGTVIDLSGELPRSFILSDHPYHHQIVWLSQLSTDTLRRRHERPEWF